MANISRIASISLATLCLTFPACSNDDTTTPGDDDGMADGVDDGATGADDGVDDGSDGAETGEPVDPNAPKYYDDILPLLIENCSACHVEEGIGPFNLEDYETAKGLAEVIELATQSRTMPPFNADNSGSCNTYKSARWLEDDEIDLISRWVEGGRQEGDPNAPQPDHKVLPTLVGDDILQLSTPANYLPVADEAGPLDDYQCFLGELNIGDTPRYITGYNVTPGNPKVTHHMVAFLVNLEADSALFGTNRALIQQLDDASPDQPGWDCFGAAGNGVIPEGTPITWAPGGGAFNFPEGTGIRIDPGYALVLQTHYNLVNGNGQDTTTVDLAMADTVEREAVNAFFDQFLFSGLGGGALEIPPGEEAWVYSWDQRLSAFNDRIASWDQVEIFGAFPHMHELGSRMQVSFLSGPGLEQEECGMYVDRWDFNWQSGYMYEEPFILSPSDSVKVTCEWNTMGKDVPTTPGLGTQNEMCLFGVYAAEVK